MTEYALDIRTHNVPAHLDIEDDIKKRGNGQMTFTIRINSGNIVDYTVVEYVDARQRYGSVKSFIISELTVSCYPRK